MQDQRKAYLLALLAVLCWSTIAVAFKISLDFIDPFQIIFLASLCSFVFFVLVNVQKNVFLRMVKNLTRRSLLSSALLGFLNPFLYYVILIHAYSMITAQEAMTLNYIWPIMLALLSVPLLRQKLGFFSVVALLISFSGIILIATKGRFTGLVFSDLAGDVLAAGSSVIWALYWILNLKDSREIPEKLMLNFFFGTIYSFVALLIFSTPVIRSFNGWLGGVYLGIFEMGLTFFLWLSALKHSRRTYLVSQFIFLSPFLSLLWIRVVLKEPILTSTLFGLMLIIAGILIQQQNEAWRNRKAGNG